MLYIVSGFMRTGTSMMMEALEAGGMSVVYSEKRNEEMNRRWGEPEYVPNDNYYELDIDDYRREKLAERYDGKVVKCLCGGLLRLPPYEVRIIFMRRPASEIRLSLMAFFGTDAAVTTLRNFDEAMENAVAILRDRRSVKSVDEVWYRDAINDPVRVFESLASHGWPIDAARSATVPTIRKSRFSDAPRAR